jgi:hypothetical protein
VEICKTLGVEAVVEPGFQVTTDGAEALLVGSGVALVDPVEDVEHGLLPGQVGGGGRAVELLCEFRAGLAVPFGGLWVPGPWGSVGVGVQQLEMARDNEALR